MKCITISETEKSLKVTGSLFTFLKSQVSLVSSDFSFFHLARVSRSGFSDWIKHSWSPIYRFMLRRERCTRGCPSGIRSACAQLIKIEKAVGAAPRPRAPGRSGALIGPLTRSLLSINFARLSLSAARETSLLIARLRARAGAENSHRGSRELARYARERARNFAARLTCDTFLLGLVFRLFVLRFGHWFEVIWFRKSDDFLV